MKISTAITFSVIASLAAAIPRDALHALNERAANDLINLKAPTLASDSISKRQSVRYQNSIWK
jgi:hypothetical protein